MLKQKIKKLLINHKLATVAVFALVIVGSGFGFVKADSVNDQINALQQENANNRNVVAQLKDQATSYQDAIDQLQAAIVVLQGKINANVAEQNRLQTEITNAENELVKQKLILGENIKAMYLEGQISTLEILASSNDLSDFVDKQTYHNSVQDKIKTTVQKINDLKAQLESQKKQVESLLAEQQAQQANLESSRNEQNTLLSYNLNQQNEYNQKN